MRRSLLLLLDLFYVSCGERKQRGKGRPAVTNHFCKGLEKVIIWFLIGIVGFKKLLLKVNDVSYKD